jgi:hypothetical protein
MGRWKLRATLSSLVFGVGVTVLTGGMMSAGAAGRPQVTTTDYDGVGCNEVLSVYKQAYAEAGFRFRRQTESKEQGAGGGTFTRMEFEYSSREHAGKKPAVTSFVFISSATNGEQRASCSVYRELFGAEPDAFTLEQWSALQPKMVSADHEATAHIKSKLGKSVPPAT